jgi:hypothetical protein
MAMEREAQALAARRRFAIFWIHTIEIVDRKHL